MTYLLALSLAASLSPAQALQEFATHCSQLDSFEQISSRIDEAGWRQFTPEDGSPMSVSLGMFGSFRSANGAAQDFDYRAFASPDHEDVTLLVTRWKNGARTTLDCKLTASTVQRQASQDELHVWTNRAPKSDSDGNNEIQSSWWEPGFFPSHTATGAVFVSQEEAKSASFLQPGLSLTGRKETRGN